MVRIGDDVYAIGDMCSHAEVSLSEGEVWCDELELECWKHGSAFSLETGEPQTLPATQPVPVYDASVVDGQVVVTAPAIGRHRPGSTEREAHHEHARDQGPAGLGGGQARSSTGSISAVSSGEVHAVMGPNGAGKSTLSAVVMGKPGYEVTRGLGHARRRRRACAARLATGPAPACIW